MNNSEPVLDPALVAAVAEKQLGRTVREVRRLSGFVHNEDFLLRTDDGDCVLKASAAPAVRAEAWACDRVAAEGIPTPRIVAVDVDCARLPRPYLIMDVLAGDPAEPDDEVIAQAGRVLRAVHAIEMPGYGFLASGGDPVRGPHSSWAAVVAAPLRELDALVADGVLDGELAGRVREVLCSAQLTAAPGRLLHGDLHPRHIFVAGGRLTGFIDWGDVAVGDPLFDLGRFARNDGAALELLLRGYEFEATPENTRSLRFYRLLWSLLALTWEWQAGGDWFDRHRAAIREGVAEFG